MSTALTNCPSCGAPLDRTATACSRCGTPIIKSGGEKTSQVLSGVYEGMKSDTVVKNAHKGASVAIHLSGLVGWVPFLQWLWLLPLGCALYLKEGHILRTHSRVWWRWQFDLLAMWVTGMLLVGIVMGVDAMTGASTFASIALIPVFLLVGSPFILAIIFGIKASIAASNGIVYTYPKLVLHRFGNR